MFCGLLGTGALIAQDLRKLKKSGKKGRNRSNDRLRWDVGDLVKVKEGKRWAEAEIVDVHPKKMKEICEDDELVIELRSDHRTLTFPRNSDKIVAVVSKKDVTKAVLCGDTVIMLMPVNITNHILQV